VTLMETNIEEPLSTDDIASLVGLSRRQLERCSSNIWAACRRATTWSCACNGAPTIAGNTLFHRASGPDVRFFLRFALFHGVWRPVRQHPGKSASESSCPQLDPGKPGCDEK
jgi:hypothetical protein